jgi:hypothetical protein
MKRRSSSPRTFTSAALVAVLLCGVPATAVAGPSTPDIRLRTYYFDDRVLRYDFGLPTTVNDRFYINITG